ncbi:alkaline-phosphatase-like protein [Pelagophyceae sp. CCMP2097]|nr:alkaline-phosphatase-like protein [Pelagophyceae sp. CCMP2097]
MRFFALSALVLCRTAFAAGPPAAGPKFDAAFEDLQSKHTEEWAQEDEAIARVPASRRLAALQDKHGKRPNIVYILADDVGWGELGFQGGGKHRGTPTPELDKMAKEGEGRHCMRFWGAYAEPSCTPSRVAINTGRHPVRTGLTTVLWPGQTDGLSPEETTVASVLSKAGAHLRRGRWASPDRGGCANPGRYHTAMWGKWHLGEAPEHSPERHGYDYAYYGLFNGAPDAWPGSFDLYDSPTNARTMFYDFPGVAAYEAETGIDLKNVGFVGRKGEERKPIGGVEGALDDDRQAAFERESSKQMKAWITAKAATPDPFFVYWATYTQQLCGAAGVAERPGEKIDRANAQAPMMAQHNAQLGELRAHLEALGISENTLLVCDTSPEYSDNGPMYAFWPTSGYSWLRGGKGDVLEGGVRVPAVAVWHGMIKPDQDPTDLIHLTDLFKTACHIANATHLIPRDRVIDGVDATPLLLGGEGRSRRAAMFHYSGETLGAVRHGDFKIHLLPGGGGGGLPRMEFYNVRRDPGEKHGEFYPGLFAVTPLQNLVKAHMDMIRRFPHRSSAAADGPDDACPERDDGTAPDAAAARQGVLGAFRKLLM